VDHSAIPTQIADWFFEIMDELTNKQFTLLLYFWGGTPRIKFSANMQPIFYYLRVGDQDLPTSSICGFSIYLSTTCNSKEDMKKYLLIAIEYGGVGFKDEDDFFG
jgi:hypothetical protein